jgi:hypothetical protein
LQVLYTRFNNSTVWAYKGLGWSLVASIVEKIISRTNSNAVRKIAKEGDFRPFYYPNKEITSQPHKIEWRARERAKTGILASSVIRPFVNK